MLTCVDSYRRLFFLRPPISPRMSQESLVSYAVIKQLYDGGLMAGDLLGPFILEVMGTERVTAKRIRSEVEARFGLRVPINLVTEALNRAPLAKQIERKNHRYALAEAFRPVASLRDSILLVEAKLESLNKAAETFFRKNGWPVAPADARRLLTFFLEREAATLAILVGDTRELPHLPKGLAAKAAAVQRFLQHLEDEKSPLLDDLKQLVAGALLSVPLTTGYAPEKIEQCNLVAYLDTNVLLPLLDLQTQDRIDAATEFMETVARAGIALFVLDFTVAEAARVLDSHLRQMRAGKADPTSELSDAISRKKWTPLELSRFIDDIETHIKRIGVSIETTGIRIGEHTPSEWMERAQMGNHVFHHNLESRAHDQLLIETIRRKREKDVRQLLNCGAIATTGHRPLARFALDRLGHRSSGTVPEIINESTLASFLWMRSPKTPLPLHAILAAAGRVARPSDEMWKSFKDSIAELAKVGEIKISDVDALAAPGFIDEELVRHELEGGGRWDNDEIRQVLHRGKQRIETIVSSAVDARLNEAREQWRVEEQRRTANQVDQLRQQTEDSITQARLEGELHGALQGTAGIDEVRARSQDWASKAAYRTRVAAQILLIIISIVLLLWAGLIYGLDKTANALNIFQIVGAPLFLVAGLTSLKWGQAIERWLERRFRIWFQRKFL